MYDGLELYQELAQWDRASRTHVENECRWLFDAATLSMSQHMHRIHNDWAQLRSATTTGASSGQNDGTDTATRVRQYEDLTEEVARGCEWLEKELSSMRPADRSKLIHHRLTVELTAMTAACEAVLLAVQDGMEEDRTCAVQQEVQGRAARRHRQHRLTSLEATQAVLKQEVTRLRAAAGALTARAEQRMQALTQQRTATFDRFAQWDLLRRQLAHVLHNQRTTGVALERIGADVTHGYLPLERSTAPRTPSPSGAEREEVPLWDPGEKVEPPEDTSTSLLQPARRTSLLPGSVEWLHRLGDRWRRMLSKSGRQDAPAPSSGAKTPLAGDSDDDTTMGTTTSGRMGAVDAEKQEQGTRGASPSSTHAHGARLALQTPRSIGVAFDMGPMRIDGGAPMAKTPPPTPFEHVYPRQQRDRARPSDASREPQRRAFLDDDVGIQRLVGSIIDAQRGEADAPNDRNYNHLTAPLPLPSSPRPTMPNLDAALGSQQRQNAALRAVMARRDDVEAILSGRTPPRSI